jgi:hypothetical protein
MFKHITRELRSHIVFTTFGAATGVILMFIVFRFPARLSYNIFYVLHPIHVVLSALVTASMYELYRRGRFGGKYNLLALLAIGYVGSVGIATLSDSVIPYLGEVLLQLPKKEIHIGFIEKWWLVNPLAIIGISVAYFRPTTKIPHAGHVLLSTWASLFHIVMALDKTINWVIVPIIFLFLFLAVWIPCCVSDIIFPLLFVREEIPEKEN